MSPARFIPVTHSAAEIADSVQRENAAAAGASYEREQNDRAQADRWREIDSAATRRFAARGAVGVSTEGQVTQTFTCHCGKHSHGHGTPDHSDGFAKIKQPTRFESPEPEWSKRVRTDAGREESRALAKRVDAARAPLSPPTGAATKSLPTTRGSKQVRITVRKDSSR